MRGFTWTHNAQLHLLAADAAGNPHSFDCFSYCFGILFIIMGGSSEKVKKTLDLDVQGTYLQPQRPASFRNISISLCTWCVHDCMAPKGGGGSEGPHSVHCSPAH